MLADRLRHYRKTKGLTQSELAARAGVSDGLIGQIETGKVNPSVNTLVALAGVLGISPGLLLEEDHKDGEALPDNYIIDLENLANHKVQYRGQFLSAGEKEKLQGILQNALDLKQSDFRPVAASKEGAAPVDMEALQAMIEQAVERAIQWRRKKSAPTKDKNT